MKKILVVGAGGLIGSAVVEDLRRDATVITAGKTSGDYQFDTSDTKAIADLLEAVGKVDAIVSTLGGYVAFKPLAEMTREDYQQSLQQKLLGQVDLAVQGAKYLTQRGSITLITGIMNHDFVMDGSAAAMVNNAVEGFAKAAALDLPNRGRINVISPGFVEDSAAKYQAYNQGFQTTSLADVSRAYRKSVFGVQTGRVYAVN